MGMPHAALAWGEENRELALLHELRLEFAEELCGDATGFFDGVEVRGRMAPKVGFYLGLFFRGMQDGFHGAGIGFRMVLEVQGG